MSIGVSGVKGGLDINWLDDLEIQTFFVARRRVAGFLIAGGYGGVITDSGGGMRVLGTQWVKRSQSLNMAVSCSQWMVSGASLTAQERKLRAWMILLPAETMG